MITSKLSYSIAPVFIFEKNKLVRITYHKTFEPFEKVLKLHLGKIWENSLLKKKQFY